MSLLRQCGTSRLIRGCGTATLLRGCTAPPICDAVTGDIRITWSGLVKCTCAQMYATAAPKNGIPFFISEFFTYSEGGNTFGDGSGQFTVAKHPTFPCVWLHGEGYGPLVCKGWSLSSWPNPNQTCDSLDRDSYPLLRVFVGGDHLGGNQIIMWPSFPIYQPYAFFSHYSLTPLVTGVAYANQLTSCGQVVSNPLYGNHYGCCTGGTVTLENP